MRPAPVLLIFASLLFPQAVNATVVPRLAGVESLAGSPFDFDQVKTLCKASTAVRDTSLAYAGEASLKVHTENEPEESKCSPYARGIFESNSPNHLESGDEFWFGVAIYLPKGFYDAHTSYTDLLRIDSYVKDDGTEVPLKDRKEINFSCWNNDDLYVRAAHGTETRDLIGPLSPANLPENTWNWVEIRLILKGSEAITELYINGGDKGGTSKGNLLGGEPLNRFRYGLVSTGPNGSGNLTAYFDRASISHWGRGPTPAATESRVSLWPLNEPSETLAADATGMAPGSYINGPTHGVQGVLAGSTAASFDGSNDYVAIEPPLPMNTKSGVTLEAWIKPDALQGTVIRRNNSYELRAQGDGSILFRVWVGEAVQSLTTGKNAIAAGAIHQLAGTYDGAIMKIYVDGKQVASQAQTGRISHGANALYIGRNDGAETYFDGVIDDPAIYSEALSSGTILENFEHGDTNGEILSQVTNQSATIGTTGWSSPTSGGVLDRYIVDPYDPPPYSAPASFELSYEGGKPKSIITTTSDNVTIPLKKAHPYAFRFQGRASNGDVQYPTGACIRLHFSNKEEDDVYCALQGDERIWQQHEVIFEPATEVESYVIELRLEPEGFLGYYRSYVFFDDIELVSVT